MIVMIIVLIVLGFCLYLLETYIPMSPPMLMIVRAAVVFSAVLYILHTFGIITLPVRLVN